MAKFVLAGKADCPLYAKAELLADSLQQSLPNFTIHKISILPDDWKEWLEATCKRNGWKHEQSPLIWRELVDRGGKEMILGGFSDFFEHCQDYYGITSDMPTDIMLSVAAENLATKMDLISEERLRLSQIQPLQIWISSALNPVCHVLIPNLLSAEVFPRVSAICLHLLDVEGDREELEWLRIETEDLALSLLHQVAIHSDLEQTFHEADVILLLDERWSDAAEEEEEEEKKRKVKARYTDYGQLIDARAKKDVKVIVSGGSLVNLRCSLLLDNAHSIDRRRFVATATQLQNKARAAIAKKLKVRTSDVTDVIVWGNISGTFYIDLQRAKVFNYDGAIKGPPFFSQPVLEVFHDRKWLATEFQDLVRDQRTAVVSKTRQGGAMSATSGILAVLKAWNGTSRPDEVISVGVPSAGLYNLPDGVVFSLPVTFTDGQWSVLLEGTIADELKDPLRISTSELRKEREFGL